jgi:hypothetical protein
MQSLSDNAYENSYHSKDNEEAINYIIKQMKKLNEKENKNV